MFFQKTAVWLKRFYWLPAVIMVVGGTICHYSFDWTNNSLAHPNWNLVGILLMILVPWLTAIIYEIDHQRGERDPLPTILFFCGGLISLFSSSGQGYISPSLMVLMAVAGFLILGFVHLITPSPRHAEG